MSLHFASGHLDEARNLVLRFHYSARVPSNIQAVYTWHEDGGLFGDLGPAVAAIFFSIPPTRWSEEVLELSRLVRRPGCSEPLTGLIARAVRALDRKWDLLVSFADFTQSHHGGIYQAASWCFDGKRERRMDGVFVLGSFVPGRSANSAWGTSSPRLLAERGVDATPHYDEGKFLYWRSRSRSGKAKAERLGLKSLPYPKPGPK
jgi:hypothetical protein